MMSCQKMTQLLSQRLDRKLTLRENAAQALHLATCSGCRNFRDNLTFLRRACEHVVADAGKKET